MSQNPLHSLFRQPKIFVSLPSKGIYSKPGSIQGNVEKIPIFSMTGSDEILMKTPDALLSGDTTVKLFESCCPAITDGWEVSSLDTDLLLAAIRIATTGSTITVTNKCPNCEELNDYDIDLGSVINHYSSCTYNNKVSFNGIIIKIHPLNYKQNNEFSLRNFRLQKQIQHTILLEDEDERKESFKKLYKDLNDIQLEIFTTSIESIDIGSTVVTEKRYINEFLQNCDKEVFDSIKKVFNENKETWKVPAVQTTCMECGEDTLVNIELDQSNFFGNA